MTRYLFPLAAILAAAGLAVPFVTQTWWFPEAITDYARRIDTHFGITLAVTGVIFLVAHLFLAYTVWHFGKRRARASNGAGNQRLEIFWTTATAILFIGLGLMGYTTWAEARFIDVRNETPDPNRLIVEVVGQQFVWNFRYAGSDGRFGPTKTELINDAEANPVGLDRDDPYGADDLMTPRMAVPVNREVEVVLKSKDVLHNFFVPELRIKLDTVPGLTQRLRFKPDKVGTYEIACSELCGLGHYKMRGFLDVMEQPDYEAWLEEQESYLQ